MCLHVYLSVCSLVRSDLLLEVPFPLACLYDSSHDLVKEKPRMVTQSSAIIFSTAAHHVLGGPLTTDTIGIGRIRLP